MILSTLDKSRKGGAYEQIPSLVLGQRWTPQLNSRNMMKVVLCVWIEPYIENDLSFCVWPVHTPTTSKEVLTLSASTSPLPYTGNKSCIVNTILSVMPKHTVYIDPCMGSAEVFFRKPRAEKEMKKTSKMELSRTRKSTKTIGSLSFLTKSSGIASLPLSILTSNIAVSF